MRRLPKYGVDPTSGELEDEDEGEDDDELEEDELYFADDDEVQAASPDAQDGCWLDESLDQAGDEDEVC